MNETIWILLATYNGEKHLRRQLDSLLSQTYTNWQLLIRDDHSTDKTPFIIRDYSEKYSSQIQIVENTEKNAGSVYNFGKLLQAVKHAKYIMFCDQDDEWNTNKIELTFCRMQEIEEPFGISTPILIFTNFLYTDNELQIIKSKKNFSVNSRNEISFSNLLAQNPVYGCTTMINRALADKVGTIPAEAENHDYWIALIAAFAGKISYLNEKTLHYRQHGSNISGSFDNNSFQKRFVRIALQKGNFAILRRKKTMLNKLEEMYSGTMNAKTKKVLADFLLLYRKSSPFLFYKNLKNGVVCQTISQTFLLYTSFLFYKDDYDNIQPSKELNKTPL